MIYMVGKMGKPQLQEVQSYLPCTIGLLLGPAEKWQTPIVPIPYATDNAVYGNWINGVLWGEELHEEWMQMLAKIPKCHPPLWVLTPDAVADWPRTVELAGLYLPHIRQLGLNTCIALQDGCDFEEARAFDTNAVFVAGSDKWKEANVHSVRDAFPDKWVHVGRVNTMRRWFICESAGVDSMDGTCLNKYRNKNLPLFKRMMDAPCLNI